MNRRQFLLSACMVPSVLSIGRILGQSLRADILVVGGGVGGCAAALAAARNGRRVILTEETEWIGGQLTQQAVPPDEHAWVEQFGTTRAYREFREGVRSVYRRHYPLRAELAQTPVLNPGGCTVSRICHEPRIALSVLESMLLPYISSGQLLVLTEHQAVGAAVAGDRVRSIEVQDLASGRRIEVEAAIFVDATETGDLLPMTGTEYVTGFESRRETGEPHAPEQAQPANMQAITWCFAVEYREGEDHTIDRPAEYGFWKDYVPELSPPWPGKLLSLTYTHPITLQPIHRRFDPRTGASDPDLWRYRRLADPLHFQEGFYPGGISLINWPQNDYWLGPVLDVPEEEARRHLERAQQLSYSLLYWLQTEAPRPDGKAGWPGLRLRGDLMGTDDGLAKRPYIRESRRIQAEFTVLEQHVATDARMQLTGRPRGEVRAESFADSVGVGSYRIDLHPSTGGDNYIDISSLPFEIPLGALIPRRVENLIPAAKNLGVTHITNGCYRLHPVEWNVGESAGMLAAFSLRSGESPRAVRNTAPLLDNFQRLLQQQGIEIRWPDPLRSPR